MAVDLSAGKTYYADSEWSTSYPVANAFDGSYNTRWSSAGTAMPHWVAVDLGSAQTVKGLEFRAYTGGLKAFKLQGSNNSTDGSDGDWVDLLSATAANVTTLQKYTVTSPGSYQWYRVLITSKYATDNTAASLWEIGMFAYTSLVPYMTADNAPSPYVVSTSFTCYSGRDAFKAFNEDIGNVATYSMMSAATNPTGILTVDLGENNAKTLKAYRLSPFTIMTYVNSRSPKDWTVEGSNDNSNWTTLDTQSGIGSWDIYSTKDFEVTNSTAYRYYLLNVTANGGDTSYWGLNMWDLLGDEPAAPVSAGIMFATFI